ncbi:MAG TPA: hypothetical protein VIS29_03215 [Streptomyces sp.]
MTLAVFERHLSELAGGWFDAATGGATRKGTAQLETVFGVRDVPVETAAAVRTAVDRLVQDGSMPESEPWRAPLGYYAHFMPEAGNRGRAAIDGLLGERVAGQDSPNSLQG